ncbi:MAG: cytochrome c biogenesis protein CcdA [Treponema sp.]|jgi:cytochrome c-type biogenesis protein|nr:cytochrome c biogenesis protein CcdA [Treponema sp.]
MDSGGLSVLAAFAAGLLSFLSPCILPLVSSCLLLISGARSEEGAALPRARIVRSTLFFAAGFTLVFIVMSVIVYGLMVVVGGAAGRVISIVSGSVVILLGVQIIFNCIPFLNYEKRLPLARAAGGPLGAFAAGLAFGAGWTPCVGPVLGGILMLAGQSGSLALAVLYLAAYSLGLALPFLLAAVFWGAFLSVLAKMKRLMPALHIASGILIICIGILMTAGRLAAFNALFFRMGFALEDWAASGALAVRLAPAALLLGLGLAPLAAALIRKKRPRIAALAVAVLCLTLAALNAAGVLNCALALARWLSFGG